MEKIIKAAISDSIATKNAVLSDEEIIKEIQSIVELIVKCYRSGGKVLFCGNGGSAADAQHLAAELSGRFYYDRPPLNAEALHVNTSYLTAVANDYSYDEIYARLIKGIGKAGDILIGLSTSGNSTNVCRAFEVARERQMVTVGLSGISGGKMRTLSDHLLKVQSNDTPRIQECHIMIGHIICQLVESELFPV